MTTLSPEILDRAHKILEPHYGPTGTTFMESSLRRQLDRFIAGIGKKSTHLVAKPHRQILAKLEPNTDQYVHVSRKIGHDKYFDLHKFRTMYSTTPPHLPPNEGSKYIYPHRFIKFMRTSSLDELPRWCNVYARDISLVGQDIFTDDELQEVDQCQYFQNHYPGAITLTTILGRKRLSVPERIELSYMLIDEINLANYLCIFARALVEPIRMSGS